MPWHDGHQRRLRDYAAQRAAKSKQDLHRYRAHEKCHEWSRHVAGREPRARCYIKRHAQ